MNQTTTFSVWDTLNNANVRINWNANPEFNKISIIWCEMKFDIEISQEMAEFLLKNLGHPNCAKNIEYFKKTHKIPKIG